jgi:hypothetical protein
VRRLLKDLGFRRELTDKRFGLSARRDRAWKPGRSCDGTEVTGTSGVAGLGEMELSRLYQ